MALSELERVCGISTSTIPAADTKSYFRPAGPTLGRMSDVTNEVPQDVHLEEDPPGVVKGGGG